MADEGKKKDKEKGGKEKPYQTPAEQPRRKIRDGTKGWDFSAFMRREPELTEQEKKERKNREILEALVAIERQAFGGETKPAQRTYAEEPMLSKEERGGVFYLGGKAVNVHAYAFDPAGDDWVKRSEKVAPYDQLLEEKLRETFRELSVEKEYLRSGRVVVNDVLDEVEIPELAFLSVDTRRGEFSVVVIPLEDRKRRVLYQIAAGEKVVGSGIVYQEPDIVGITRRKAGERKIEEILRFFRKS
ncbi:hypothetical protein HYS48_02880 [Candidatus Woesearchaeota archaeon]|nr:hypothetical protein [Candidatus Woesearchaeota archaeon]